MLVSQQLQQARRQQQQAAALLLQQQQQQKQKQQNSAANEDVVPAETDAGSSCSIGETADADTTEKVANSEESISLQIPSPSAGNVEAKSASFKEDRRPASSSANSCSESAVAVSKTQAPDGKGKDYVVNL